MQQGRDALLVMMRHDWGFDSRHDLAPIEIDIVDAPATWTSIARHDDSVSALARPFGCRRGAKVSCATAETSWLSPSSKEPDGKSSVESVNKADRPA
jgi:hypothetical protein